MKERVGRAGLREIGLLNAALGRSEDAHLRDLQQVWDGYLGRAP